jgi:serine/threonine protein phosphatase PrpC
MIAARPMFSAALSHTGLVRQNNEDRILCDPANGIFAVADGMGGHVAGEKAAEQALEILRARLVRPAGTIEQRVREALALANNAVYEFSVRNPELRGMGCVLTCVVIADGQVSVGHVGDTRLYELQPGSIRKLTRDHSPVGEREDSGEMEERDAMRHPRRNEVFRDLGSQQRTPDDTDYFDFLQATLPSNSALLLCSDGLTDQVTSARIREIVEFHASAPDTAVEALVAAANESGGLDNVSVVLVEGEHYAAGVRSLRNGPAIRTSGRSQLLSRFAFVLCGLAAAALALLAWRMLPRPVTHTVGANSPDRLQTIAAALARADPGDTVLVNAGHYPEVVHLKNGVSLIALGPATINGAVKAESLSTGRIAGFRIQANSGTDVGLLIDNSNIEAEDLVIAGARAAGVEISGRSSALLRASEIVDNPGTGVLINSPANPRIRRNVIRGNGGGTPAPGIRIMPGAEPVIEGNSVWNNAAEAVWVPPLFPAENITATNYLAIGEKAERRIRVVVP